MQTDLTRHLAGIEGGRIQSEQAQLPEAAATSARCMSNSFHLLVRLLAHGIPVRNFPGVPCPGEGIPAGAGNEKSRCKPTQSGIFQDSDRLTFLNMHASGRRDSFPLNPPYGKLE